MPEQTEGFALQLDDRVVQQAELLGGLPFARADIPLIVLQPRRQVEQQHDRMLRHRRRAVALAVTDGDAMGAGSFKVDVIGAGGRHQDQFEFGAGGQGFAVERNLVADSDLGALQAFDHILRRGLLKQLQLAETVVQLTEIEIPRSRDG